MYLLDANVFIQAKNTYYGFDICPAFWDCVRWHHGRECMHSIDRIKEELTEGNDELKTWIAGLPPGFFASTTVAAVIDLYSKMMESVMQNDRIFAAAKAKFAADADGWLIAYAGVNHLTVVTNEALAMEARSRIPIPNLCRQFNVQCVNPFDMLRSLATPFTWTPH